VPEYKSGGYLYTKSLHTLLAAWLNPPQRSLRKMVMVKGDSSKQT